MTALVRLYTKRYRKRTQSGEQEYISYLVTLPKKVVEALGWREGQQLKVVVDGRRLILEPL